jgi:hypothetical protein
VKKLLIALAIPAILGGLAGCGDDDGGEVRDLGGESSGSGSGSASGSEASGSGSETEEHASGSEAACVPVGDPASADETVEVTLDDFSIEPAATSAAAGNIHFATENVGEHTHELVIAEGEDLATADDGSVDEAQLPDGALIGEIEGYPAGETCDGVFELEAGTYTLFCNIVEEEDGTIEAHVAEGMITTFTVE